MNDEVQSLCTAESEGVVSNLTSSSSIYDDRIFPISSGESWEPIHRAFLEDRELYRLSDDGTMYINNNSNKKVPVLIANKYIDILFRIEDYSCRVERLEFAEKVIREERLDEEDFSIHLQIKKLNNLIYTIGREAKELCKEYPEVIIIAKQKFGEFKYNPYLGYGTSDSVKFPNTTGKLYYMNPFSGDKKYLMNNSAVFPKAEEVKVKFIPLRNVRGTTYVEKSSRWK